MDKKNIHICFAAMASFAVLEFLMLSYMKGYFGIYFSPIIFFLASAGVAISALYLVHHLKDTDKIREKDLRSLLVILPFIAGLIYYGYSIFSQHPIDDSKSDVFAQVLSPAKWLLQGDYPYQDVVLPSYTMHNTYLPMQWLPFVFAVGFDFDPRWIPLVSWVSILALFAYLVPINFYAGVWKNMVWYAIVFCFALFGVFGFISQNSFDYSVTLEMLPVAYYILLVLALLKGNWMFMGITMGFCSMSRFSILLLIPFLIWFIWKRYGTMVLLKSAMTTIVFILVVFILPFMTKDAHIVSKIIGNYDNGAFGEWQVHEWQLPGEEPFQLARGMGAAIFFKRLYEYDIKDGIQHLKQVGFLFSIVSAFFMIYLYERNKKIINHDWVLLGGIKLYFTVFYTFVLIPYPYLFILPVTVTGLILIKAYSDIYLRSKFFS